METEKVKNLLVFVADRTQPVVGREDVILPAALTHPHGAAPGSTRSVQGVIYLTEYKVSTRCHISN